MLESISIKNFQGLEDLEIEFDCRITTIVGDTDAGKSSSLRAIRWVAANFPFDRLIRDGAETATAKLRIDGHEIIRLRSKSDNLYFLDGQEFRAFGVNVPEPIAKILQLGLQNFQGQHDTVYWLQDSAGEVSRRLNAVVDLGVIDKALGEIGGKVRAVQAEVQVSRERLTKAKARKAELSWIVEADQDYQVVETLEGAASSAKNQLGALQGLLGELRGWELQRVRAEEFGVDVNQVGMLGRATLRLAERRAGLVKSIDLVRQSESTAKQEVPDISAMDVLVGSFYETGNKRISLERRISVIREQELIVSKVVPGVSSMTMAIEEYEKVRMRRQLLNARLSGLRSAAEQYRAAKIKSIEADGELDEVEGVCPECGQDLAIHSH